MKKILQKITVIGLASYCALSWGQAAPESPQSVSSATKWTAKDKEGNWIMACPEQGGGSGSSDQMTCRIIQNLNVKVGEGQQRLLSISLYHQGQTLYTELILPFGLDLQQGIGWKIDEKDAMTAKFSTCLPSGCVAKIALTDPISKDMQSSSKLKVYFRALGAAQPAAADIELQGLKRLVAAMDGVG
jgi:invasion protein IalB